MAKSIHALMNEKYGEISHILKESSSLDIEARAAITTLNEAYFRDDFDGFNLSLENVKKLYEQQSLFDGTKLKMADFQENSRQGVNMARDKNSIGVEGHIRSRPSETENRLQSLTHLKLSFSLRYRGKTEE